MTSTQLQLPVQRPGPSEALRFSIASFCCAVAEASTLPLDLCKARLQLQNELSAKPSAASVPVEKLGMVRMLGKIYRDEGLLAMWSGLPASVLRQAIYGGISTGAYKPVRDYLAAMYGAAGDAPLLLKALAGGLTGGVGQAVASPTDVVKLRLQADGRLVSQGQQPRYKGTLDAFVKIAQQEGRAGFFRGVWPNTQQAAVINGCGIASYDETKRFVCATLGTDQGLLAKLLAALTSGLVSATVSSPFDVIKTRLMVQPPGSKLYSSE